MRRHPQVSLMLRFDTRKDHFVYPPEIPGRPSGYSASRCRYASTCRFRASERREPAWCDIGCIPGRIYRARQIPRQDRMPRRGSQAELHLPESQVSCHRSCGPVLFQSRRHHVFTHPYQGSACCEATGLCIPWVEKCTRGRDLPMPHKQNLPIPGSDVRDCRVPARIYAT